MICQGVVDVYYFVLGRWVGGLVRLLLDVCWDGIVGRGKVSQ